MELVKDGKTINVSDPKPFEKNGWEKAKTKERKKDGKR